MDNAYTEDTLIEQPAIELFGKHSILKSWISREGKNGNMILVLLPSEPYYQDKWVTIYHGDCVISQVN